MWIGYHQECILNTKRKGLFPFVPFCAPGTMKQLHRPDRWNRKQEFAESSCNLLGPLPQCLFFGAHSSRFQPTTDRALSEKYVCFLLWDYCLHIRFAYVQSEFIEVFKVVFAFLPHPTLVMCTYFQCCCMQKCVTSRDLMNPANLVPVPHLGPHDIRIDTLCTSNQPHWIHQLNTRVPDYALCMVFRTGNSWWTVHNTAYCIPAWWCILTSECKYFNYINLMMVVGWAGHDWHMLIDWLIDWWLISCHLGQDV